MSPLPDVDDDEAAYVARAIPGATLVRMEGPERTLDWTPAFDAIRGFVGVERPPVGLDAVLATVLFTDIVGSTERQAELGDRAWKGLVERHHELVRRALDRWRGVERDTAGDGFFATFDGPARAVRAALEIRDAVRTIGVESGPASTSANVRSSTARWAASPSRFGSRVAATAGSGEVLVSQTVKDLVAGPGLTFTDAGEHQLKGVPDRWRLYRVTGS